jgi:hypothetical protein
LKLGHDCFLQNPLRCHAFTYHPFTWHYIVLVTEKSSLNKLQTNNLSVYNFNFLFSIFAVNFLIVLIGPGIICLQYHYKNRGVNLKVMCFNCKCANFVSMKLILNCLL